MIREGNLNKLILLCHSIHTTIDKLRKQRKTLLLEKSKKVCKIQHDFHPEKNCFCEEQVFANIVHPFYLTFAGKN